MGKCGCGRSTTGECIGLHRLTPEEWALVEQQREKMKMELDTKDFDVSTGSIMNH